MPIDRAGIPYIAASLTPAALLMAAHRPLWAVPLVALAGAFGFFFRDPARVTPDRPEAVIAPADGRVMVAGDPEPGVAPPGAWLQLSVFLSPLDVHVNRMPVSGRVTRIDYRPGRCVPAYRSDASTENERNELWIDHAGLPVVCRQITGVLVRRVVCRVATGATVRAGERFGMMKFGSRVDLFLPRQATLLVSVGSRVRGGETIVGTL